MSAMGKIPFTHTFTAFATRRVCDQVTLSVAYAGLNVKMMGSDPGVTAAVSYTHLDVYKRQVPAILAGIRTALSSGWMCVVAAEMIVAKQGVGFLIVRGQESGDTALIVVCMLVIGIVSMLLSTILSKLEGVLCPWQFSKTK